MMTRSRLVPARLSLALASSSFAILRPRYPIKPTAPDRGHWIIIGGEDGELVDDVIIDGVVTVARSVAADTTDRDTIIAGDGNNLVFGDNGQVTAATSDLNRFTTWTTESDDGLNVVSPP